MIIKFYFLILINAKKRRYDAWFNNNDNIIFVKKAKNEYI